MDRDKACQLPEKHDCNTSKSDHAHHVIPQHYSKFIGIKNPDVTSNGIRLCSNAHVGEIKPGVPGVHPDIIPTKSKYRQGNKNAFAELAKEREEKLKKKEPYWNTKWDRLFHIIAFKNEEKYQEEGHIPPEKKK